MDMKKKTQFEKYPSLLQFKVEGESPKEARVKINLPISKTREWVNNNME